jgi:hypothetical protein
MAVPITTTPAFHAGEPVPLFHLPGGFMTRNATPGQYGDMSSDGKSSVFLAPVADTRHEEITVITNWQAARRK